MDTTNEYKSVYRLMFSFKKQPKTFIQLLLLIVKPNEINNNIIQDDIPKNHKRYYTILFSCKYKHKTHIKKIYNNIII